MTSQLILHLTPQPMSAGLSVAVILAVMVGKLLLDLGVQQVEAESLEGRPAGPRQHCV